MQFAKHKVISEHRKEVEDFIAHLRSSNLTESQEDWVDKMEEAWDNYGRLTTRQWEVLQSIGEEVPY